MTTGAASQNTAIDIPLKVYGMVQYACIDCGKLSGWRHPVSFNGKTRDNYRCKFCGYSHRIPCVKRVQYSCIDCGKLSTLRKPSEFKKASNQYRCKGCANKLEALKRKSEGKIHHVGKVQFACIDCGKLSNLKGESHFSKPRERYRCVECASILNLKFINEQRKLGKIKKVQYTCIVCGKESGWRRPKDFKKPREEYKCPPCSKSRGQSKKTAYVCIDCGIISRFATPSQIHTPRDQYRCRKCTIKTRRTPPIKIERVQYSCICCGKLSRVHPKTRFKKPPEKYMCCRCWGKHFGDLEREKMKQLREDPEAYIARYNFSYHDVAYSERQKKTYCEKWCPDLWCRIDAAQGNQSILSGKTKDDNGGHALSRHHVYWQEKACCVWDEDAQGYYAMIDLGTPTNPQPYKHYIKGDPNKFILLTRREHGLIRGNKKLGTNKITWIKVIEDLIETKLDGKCYLTKEETGMYLLENDVK